MAEKNNQNTKESLVMPDLSREQPVFSWQASEYEKRPFSTRRTLLMGLIFALIIVAFVFMKQWTGIAVVIFSFVVLIIYSKTATAVIRSALFTTGVVVDQSVYSYGRFKSFWISYFDTPKIKLQLTGTLAGQVTLPIADSEDIEQIRLFLSKYLPEEEDKGSDLVDIINHWLRF